MGASTRVSYRIRHLHGEMDPAAVPGHKPSEAVNLSFISVTEIRAG